MAISGIISVAGKPGLYKIVTQTKNGLIAESLTDDKRIPVYATQKVSALEEISIYTYDEDMPLSEVMQKMYEKTGGKEAPDHKSDPDKLRDFFSEVIDYDKERVYNSDLKKLFQWFNILVGKGLLEPEKEEKKKKGKEKEEGEGKTKKVAAKTTKTTAAGKKPAKAAALKKAAPKVSGAKAAVKSAPRKTGGGK